MSAPDWDAPFSRAERKFDAGEAMTLAEVATLVNGYRAEISALHDTLALELEPRAAFESGCG